MRNLTAHGNIFSSLRSDTLITEPDFLSDCILSNRKIFAISNRYFRNRLT